MLRPQAGKQELMLNIQADVIIAGGAAGSAKSYTSLLRSCPHLEDPKYRAIYFRRNGTQLEGAGGLWETGKDMFSPWSPTPQEQKMRLKFPSGASIKFSHLEHEKNKIDHQGLQYTAIFWDELTHFTETQFTYLLSRARSESETDSFTFATCNPDADKFMSHVQETVH